MWCEIDAKKSFNRLIWGVTIAYKPEPKEYGLAYKWVKQLQNNLFFKLTVSNLWSILCRYTVRFTFRNAMAFVKMTPVFESSAHSENKEKK